LKYRKHKGFTLSEIGVGCYALSGAYGPKDRAEFGRMLNRAHELGVNFFDTADSYGDGERILGETVRSFRQEVYIATKVGVKAGDSPNLSSNYVKLACSRSLERLQTEYIDLYQVHFDDPDTPVEETVGALEELVKEGKVRRYGLGHLPADKVQVYCQVGHLFSILLELSAAARHSRENLLPLCRKHGVGAIAFSVTGRGLLTKRYQKGVRFGRDDIRSLDPLFQRERFESGLRVAEKIVELSDRHGKTPVEVAIAWVLSQQGVICALTGPSTVVHLEENLGGGGWQLPSDDLEDLESLFKREDAWLRRTQLASIREILSGSLSKEPLEAFVDLVYVIESALLLDLKTDRELLPTFQELYGMRRKLEHDAHQKLAAIQQRLRCLIAI
jgi:aryl-alcohol dehydrogenase-like predicted oxidoreductase